MRSSVARMLFESLKRGDPLDAEWFWEAGMVSARDGTPLDIVIWDAVREMLEQQDPELLRRGNSQLISWAAHASD